MPPPQPTAAAKGRAFGSAKLWALAAVATAGVIWWQVHRPVRYAPGMLVGEAPKQGAVEGKQPWKLKDGSRVVPLATYEITARLLHRERYRFDALGSKSNADMYSVGLNYKF